MKPYSTSNFISFPAWAKRRDDSWDYTGWILHPPGCDLSFEDRIKRALRSDHGEKREADIYPHKVQFVFVRSKL